jgi:sucrose-6-phosphate hydrolase SacC (GH32 family)
MEIEIEIESNGVEIFAVEIKSGSKREDDIDMSFGNSEFILNGLEAPLSLKDNKGNLNLRLFLDRSVLEVFANETLCATKVISPLIENATLEIHARGQAIAKYVKAWPLNSIW